jgi:hypothetical protein
MRNPLNSINSQIIQMKHLNLKIKELVEDGQIITVDQLKEKIKLITTEQDWSLNILTSTERILTFQVADILDLS